MIGLLVDIAHRAAVDIVKTCQLLHACWLIEAVINSVAINAGVQSAN